MRTQFIAQASETCTRRAGPHTPEPPPWPTTTASSQLPSATPAWASVWLGSANRRAGEPKAAASCSADGKPAPSLTRRRLTSDGSTSSFASANQRRLNRATVSLGTAARSLYCVPSPVRLTHSVQPAAWQHEDGRTEALSVAQHSTEQPG
jgi:hypothetical protein